MTLSKQLELFLKTSGMTVSELARRSGVSRKTLHSWSIGHKPRDLDQVRKVCDVVGCSIDQLVYGEGFEKKSHGIDALVDSEGFLSGIFEIKIRQVKK